MFSSGVGQGYRQTRYKKDPIAYIEEVLEIKLLEYQKTLLKGMFEGKVIINSKFNGKKFIQDLYVRYLKDMEVDFLLATSKGLEVYEKGKIKEIKEYKMQ